MLRVWFHSQPEEKMKFDSIFDSLGPVGGMLSGDKVKPVLLNSKLPVDILGRVWRINMTFVFFFSFYFKLQMAILFISFGRKM